MKPRAFLLLGMVLLAALSRVVPHPPNFTPVCAIGLFGAAYFRSKWAAFTVPLAAMFLSDLALEGTTRLGAYRGWLAQGSGLHKGMWVVYAAVAMVAALGLLLRRKKPVRRVAGTVLAGSVLFFLVTNFALWVCYGLYPHTFDGVLDPTRRRSRSSNGHFLAARSTRRSCLEVLPSQRRAIPASCGRWRILGNANSRTSVRWTGVLVLCLSLNCAPSLEKRASQRMQVAAVQLLATTRRLKITATDCPQQGTLWDLGKQQVTVDFDGGQLVSDAGLLAIRELDKGLGVLSELAKRLPDPRAQKYVTHSREAVLTQQVYQILGDYADCNDANRLRDDPLFQTIADVSPDSEQPLASGSTLARFQQAYTRRQAELPLVERPVLRAMGNKA